MFEKSEFKVKFLSLLLIGIIFPGNTQQAAENIHDQVSHYILIGNQRLK